MSSSRDQKSTLDSPLTMPPEQPVNRSPLSYPLPCTELCACLEETDLLKLKQGHGDLLVKYRLNRHEDDPLAILIQAMEVENSNARELPTTVPSAFDISTHTDLDEEYQSGPTRQVRMVPRFDQLKTPRSGSPPPQLSPSESSFKSVPSWTEAVAEFQLQSRQAIDAILREPRL